MPTYYNPHSYAVHLTGPDGSLVTIRGREEAELGPAYEQYVARGFIQRKPVAPPPLPLGSRPPHSGIQLREEELRKRQLVNQARRAVRRAEPVVPQRQYVLTRQPLHKGPATKLVGRQLSGDATQAFRGALSKGQYPISDGIGVGILSYNRLGSLRRLVQSLERYSDLDRTTVFISDDGSTAPGMSEYLQQLRAGGKFVVLDQQPRLGVAGNSNRLLRCLARFKHFLLLNDDVELLRRGWEQFYPQALRDTGYAHLVHRQPGVYGAERGDRLEHGGRQLTVVRERPHGAVLAASHTMLQRAGYFDERYGLYGMEHVDWSSRAAECGLQPPGFYDAAQSDHYFRVHHEGSAVTESVRRGLLKEGQKQFAVRQPGRYVPPLAASAVPALSFVVPFRDVERGEAIATVVNNLRAQRFPVVELVLVEQDSASRCGRDGLEPCVHQLVSAAQPLFNKSLAFNRGVQLASHDHLILHDADILAQADYAGDAYATLQQHESCFLGGRVIYATQPAAAAIVAAGRVLPDTECDRVVGYFEGGSLALTRAAYWGVGGHNEEFWGYGNEDCDFYYRLKGASRFLERRDRDLLHLWHPRVEGWQAHHGQNKQLELRLRALDFQQYLKLCRERVAHYLPEPNPDGVPQPREA